MSVKATVRVVPKIEPQDARTPEVKPQARVVKWTDEEVGSLVNIKKRKKPEPKKPVGASSMARNLFQARTKQRESINNSIKLEGEEKAKKLTALERIEGILKGQEQSCLRWHKKLKELNKPLLSPREVKALKDRDVILEIDQRMTVVSKLMNVVLKEIETERKNVSNGTSSLASIKKSVDEFMDGFLLEQQKFTEEWRASGRVSTESTIDVPQTGLVTNVFSVQKHNPGAKIEDILKGKRKKKTGLNA